MAAHEGSVGGRKVHPDPIRQPPPSSSRAQQLSGCGAHRSYRHLQHQRGHIGTFHVRLLEARSLSRKHWSALSLGPAKHLGLSRAHGEVSSFGTLRLAFWTTAQGQQDQHDSETHNTHNHPASFESTAASTIDTTSSSSQSQPLHFDVATKSPLTPLFDQGSLRSFSPARSPFFPSFTQYTQKHQLQPNNESDTNNADSTRESKPSSLNATMTLRKTVSNQENPFAFPTNKLIPIDMQSTSSSSSLPSPDHYAKEQFCSSVVYNDSNPIWGNAHCHSPDNGSYRSSFRIPLLKDDLLPSIRTDGARVALEIRLDEEMAPTESLLVGGALSHALSAATTVASTVPIVGHTVGKQAKIGAAAGIEMLGLGKDRLIGKGFVDLMPLLLGIWEEDWEKESENKYGSSTVDSEGEEEGDNELDVYGRIDPDARMRRRRVERMGILDVWVPLHHPSSYSSISSFDEEKQETTAKAHLLISYEPNGMTPKLNDVVALESFARRPFVDGSHSIGSGPVITPIVPPLSPLLVVDTRASYLLLEYTTSRTVTSVDRSGNVKSSRWERSHRVRIHRNAAFVIERRTLLDTVGDVARLPGDIVLSTSIGQEIAEASAPIVAGAMELMGPALLWGKLMIAAGGTGLRAGVAGVRAATEAVVATSQEMALQNRKSEYMQDRGGGESGVYTYG